MTAGVRLISLPHPRWGGVWYHFQWQINTAFCREVDQNYFRVVQELLATWGARISKDHATTPKDKIAFHLHCLYGSWLQQNVGEQGVDWDIDVPYGRGLPILVSVMFAHRDRAALFKLTHG